MFREYPNLPLTLATNKQEKLNGLSVDNIE